MTLGKHLHDLRIRSGLRMVKVARAIDRSRGTAYGFEAGTIRPSADSLQALLDLYGASDAERLMAWRLLTESGAPSDASPSPSAA